MNTLFQHILLYVAVFIVIFGVWFGASAIEASTYSRLTGKKVTAFDAMFIDLRVVDEAK